MFQKIVFFVVVAVVAKLASSASPVYDQIMKCGYLLGQNLDCGILEVFMGENPPDPSDPCMKKHKQDLCSWAEKFKNHTEALVFQLLTNTGDDRSRKPLRNIAKTVTEFTTTFWGFLGSGILKDAVQVKVVAAENITNYTKKLAKKYDELAPEFRTISKVWRKIFEGFFEFIDEETTIVTRNLKNCMEKFYNQNF